MSGKGFLREKLFIEGNLNSSPWTPAEEQDIKQEIRLSNQEILAHYSPESMAKLIQSRLNSTQTQDQKSITPPKNIWKKLLMATPLAAAALITFFLSANFLFTSKDDMAERLKGFEPRLLVFQKTGTEVKSITDQTWVSPGDRLQLGYISGGNLFGTLFSIDGRNQITQHFPEKGPEATLLSNGEVLFPWSYELDSAPLFERFYFVTSQKPFNLAPVFEMVKKTPHQSNFGSGLKVQVLHLNKRSTP